MNKGRKGSILCLRLTIVILFLEIQHVMRIKLNFGIGNRQNQGVLARGVMT